MKTKRWGPLGFSRRASAVAVAIVVGVALALVPVPAMAGMQPMSAGVSAEDRAPHPDYPVKLVFAMSSGAYLADVNVTIRDLEGKEVLSAHALGPWLFLDLPAGQYRVVAVRTSGEKAAAVFTVGGEGQAVIRLVWSGKE